MRKYRPIVDARRTEAAAQGLGAPTVGVHQEHAEGPRRHGTSLPRPAGWTGFRYDYGLEQRDIPADPHDRTVDEEFFDYVNISPGILALYADIDVQLVELWDSQVSRSVHR